MHAKFIHNGDSVDYVPGVTIPAGSILTMNGGYHRLAAIATREIPVNTKGSLAIKGVFEVPAAEGNYDFGVSVYWNTDTLKAQNVAGQGLEAVFLGIAVSRRTINAAGEYVVQVLLMPAWTAG